jgi:pseudaminic acid biosynthesis-associated methylase
MQHAINPIEKWTGEFGDQYQIRNASRWRSIKSRARMFENILEKMGDGFPRSVLEVGAGAGDNLRALDMIYERSKTELKIMGCDPNAAARESLKDIATAMPGDLSALPYNDDCADMVFTSGVLVHIPPDQLETAMTEIHRTSRRWILSIEYFNPTPEEVTYRGHDGLLWRRDWGEEWLRLFPMLKIAGYGFMWKRMSGLDNVTWFLFDKQRAG